MTFKNLLTSLIKTINSFMINGYSGKPILTNSYVIATKLVREIPSPNEAAAVKVAS